MLYWQQEFDDYGCRLCGVAPSSRQRTKLCGTGSIIARHTAARRLQIRFAVAHYEASYGWIMACTYETGAVAASLSGQVTRCRKRSLQQRACSRDLLDRKYRLYYLQSTGQHLK